MGLMLARLYRLLMERDSNGRDEGLVFGLCLRLLELFGLGLRDLVQFMT